MPRGERRSWRRSRPSAGAGSAAAPASAPAAAAVATVPLEMALARERVPPAHGSPTPGRASATAPIPSTLGPSRPGSWAVDADVAAAGATAAIGGATAAGDHDNRPLPRWMQETASRTAMTAGPGPAVADDVWLCEVITADEAHAGTKSNVYLDIYGEKGCVSGVHLNQNQEKFARDSTVTISLRLDNDNLGRLYKVRVTHDRSGSGPNWLPQRLVLTHVSGPHVVPNPLGETDAAWGSSMGGLTTAPIEDALAGATATMPPLPLGNATEHYVFDCNGWLTKHVPSREIPARGPYVDPARLPKLVTYTVKTRTGSGEHKKDAGTDAKVHIQLFGLLGDTGVRKLNHSDTHKDKFEAGHEDSFKIEAVHLGDLTKVVIGHDNTGGIMHQMHAKGDAGWYLDKVVVFDPTLPGEVEFPCDRWLAQNKDDGKIERELVRARPTAAAENFLIETKTSKRGSKSGIAGPTFPWVLLTGSNGKTDKTPLTPSDGTVAFRAGDRDAFTFRAPSIGQLRKVAIGYSPKGKASPWVPEVLWVTCQGAHTRWDVGGERSEIGGPGWPNQRTLVAETEAVPSTASSTTTAEAPHRRGRPHSIAITPTGLKAECWSAPERPPKAMTKEKSKGVDCWNRNYVPSRPRRPPAATSSSKLPYNVCEVVIERADDTLGFAMDPVGQRGARVTQVLVGGPAEGRLQVGDLVRSINKRDVKSVSPDELKSIMLMTQQLDLEILRKRVASTGSGKPKGNTGGASLLPEQEQREIPSALGRQASTFRDPAAVKKAMAARRERDNVRVLRQLLIDVPAASKDDFSSLRQKMATLDAAGRAKVYAAAKAGSGHVHARAVWRQVLELEMAVLLHLSFQATDLNDAVRDARANVENAAQQHTIAVNTLAAAAAAANAEGGASNVKTQEVMTLAKATEKRQARELDKAHATLKANVTAASRAAAAAAVVAAAPQHSTNRAQASKNENLAAARVAVAKAEREHTFACSAQRAGATHHANDSGVYPVVEAVNKTKAEVDRARATYEKAQKSTSVQQSHQSGKAAARNIKASPHAYALKGRGKRVGLNESEKARLADSIVTVAGNSKTALLSIEGLHSRLADAGYRYTIAEVQQVIETYEPIRALVESQRRRKLHNESAVKEWESKKRSSRIEKSASIRREKQSVAREARDINAKSLARVHYNPWAAALGLGVRPTPGEPAGVLYTGSSTLRWDRNERRTLGGVSQQSWYHGAKQVADATTVMATLH